MTDLLPPIVVAFDGSPPAREAVRAAAQLFPGRRLLVVSVWEAGLAYLAQPPSPDPVALSPTFLEAEAVDEAEHGLAESMASEGAELATDAGADAEPIALRDLANVADTIVDLADERGAAAIVIGTRGSGGVMARLFGSTSRALLHDARCPVVVVRVPEED
jgi:nucleotide-binding universal stress UspA family protein